MDRFVHGLKAGLGFGDIERRAIEGDIVVSAPGKVILFGEHAVVHGIVRILLLTRQVKLTPSSQTAIATSVNLRCLAVLSPRSDDKVALEIPNLDLEAEWDISSLPWNLLPLHAEEDRHQADKELDPPLLAAIEDVVKSEGSTANGIGSQVAFLYLYMLMAGRDYNA